MGTTEILNATGLNWNVRKEQIQTVSGLIIPDKTAIIREDNNAVLSVMGDGYEPYNNTELLELLHNITQSTGLEIHKGGMFGGGEKVFFQLKSDNLILNGDKIEGYVSGINSFDGSTSLSFGHSTMTISCMNAFFSVYKQLDSKIKHSASMRPRIDTILFGIDKLLKEEKHNFNTIKKLNEIPVTPEMIEFVKKTLFELSNTDMLLPESLSTRKMNQIEAFDFDLKRELQQKENSVWGLMSGVTRYTTHTANKNENRAMLNKIVGGVGNRERQIWNHFEKMTA